MTQIKYQDDVTFALAMTRGSDGRLNVSSRSDERIYYNSRDEGQTYVWTSTDGAAAAGEYIIYIKNTSASKNLIIKEVILSPGVDMTFKIALVTGTPSSTGITGYNLNRNSANVAAATAHGDAAVDNLTPTQVIRIEQVLALTTADIEFHDALQLGQNDAIAIEGDVNAGGVLHAQIIGYFE